MINPNFVVRYEFLVRLSSKTSKSISTSLIKMFHPPKDRFIRQKRIIDLFLPSCIFTKRLYIEYQPRELMFLIVNILRVTTGHMLKGAKRLQYS